MAQVVFCANAPTYLLQQHQYHYSMNTKQLLRLIIAACAFSVKGANAYCYAEAARLAEVPELLLVAIADVESNQNKAAIKIDLDGKRSYGLMQIRETHLRELHEFGVTREKLIEDACLNIKIGASLLYQNIKRYGYTWDAVGALNVGCKRLSLAECVRRRLIYVKKVQARIRFYMDN